MTSGEPFLRVRGLRKTFGTRTALAGLDLAVDRGEIFGLLGPNGAGKTTAFKTLAGLMTADAGEVWLEGETLPLGSFALRRRLGVVFQHPSVDLQLTARENLLLGASLYGVPRAEARRRAERALALMELGERAREKVVRFSGGLRRRLEIARVLLHEPDLLLLDEPGQGIDPEALRRIWDQLAELSRARKVTALLTTHLPDEAERCHRVAVLDEGRVVAQGTPEELRARVAGDVLQVRGSDPAGIVAAVREHLGLGGQVLDGAALIETGMAGARVSGHALVPRIAELFVAGRLESIAVRRPTLADVFAKLTGRRLGAEDREVA